jgi:transcriptional regulator with XRE-family HTH domain
MNNIGNNIRIFRELKNLSQEYMAEALGFTQTTLSRIENGHVSLKMDRLQLIADFLEVDLSTLLSATNNFHFVFNNVANQSGYINSQTINSVDIESIRKIIREELGKIK